MKPFRFKKFTLQQHKEVFRVGTDGVLLGALATVTGAENILEVGTGTGLITLMIAQRNADSIITAIDINTTAVEIAGQNCSASPFRDRIQVQHLSYSDFEPHIKFDLIISNPPYFEENSSEKDITARQQRELSFETLICKTAEILEEHGRFCVIIPHSSAEYFKQICLGKKLYLIRKITIFGNENVEPKRAILEFSFKETENCKDEKFIIEKAPRVYSEQYLKATEQFHQFG